MISNAEALRTIEELERLGCKIDAILPDGTHRYFSTHCRCGEDHNACSAREMTGRDVQDREGWSATIERKPAQCKSCAAPCVCSCHSGTGRR